VLITVQNKTRPASAIVRSGNVHAMVIAVNYFIPILTSVSHFVAELLTLVDIYCKIQQ